MASTNPTKDATQEMLFRISWTVSDSIIRLMGDAFAGLKRRDEGLVIDSVYEVQIAVTKIRALMLLVRDLDQEKEKYV